MNKLYRSMNWMLLLALLLGMMLTACQTAVETTVAPEPTVAVVEPTATDVPPTATPEPEPTPVPTDWVAVWKEVVAEINPDNGYLNVSAAKLNEELVEKPPFILDVREASELEANGYIAGAVNIPVREVLKNLDKLPGVDDAIVVYCGSGHRGAILLPVLKALGYTNVRNLAGGLGAWTKAGFPVESGSPEAAAAISTAIIADEQLYLGLDEYMSNLPEGFMMVKADAFNEELASGETPFILDVRTQKEWDEQGYIEGATLVPYAELLDNLDKLPSTDTPMVVYCGSGHRAGIMLTVLHFMGYTDVRSLGGGMGAWKAGQFPVEGWVDWNATWASFLSGLPADYYTTSAANLNTALVENPPFVLDVREASEVESAGYIAGAVNIPVREVLANLDKLPAKDQPIVVTCASGHRGAMIMAALRMLGYSDVRNLGGGMGGWVKAELPVVTDPIAAPVAGTAPEVDPVVFAGLNKFLSELPDGYYTVKAADLNIELAGSPAPLIVDVRTADELAADGFIEGSINIVINELFNSLDQLPSDKAAPMVIMCKSGHRGALGMMALLMNGYSNVRNLGGGLNAWIAAELPVAGK
jgi:rhodanese-related sulfurtransferase